MKDFTLRDAGQTMMGLTHSGPGKQEKYYQTVSFDIEQLPEIGVWEVGKEYTLIVKVKQVVHSMREEKDNTRERGDFEILKVANYVPEVDEYGPEVKRKLKLS